MNDITFKIDNAMFNYRVSALIIHDDKILLIKHDNKPYYITVGGRVQLGETSAEAVLREAKEETGLDFVIDRFGFIHENFFTEKYLSKQFHEISYYYYLLPDPKIDLVSKNYSSDNFFQECPNNHLIWTPLEQLKDTPLLPEFLKTELLKNHKTIKHIITKN